MKIKDAKIKPCVSALIQDKVIFKTRSTSRQIFQITICVLCWRGVNLIGILNIYVYIFDGSISDNLQN